MRNILIKSAIIIILIFIFFDKFFIPAFAVNYTWVIIGGNYSNPSDRCTADIYPNNPNCEGSAPNCSCVAIPEPTISDNESPNTNNNKEPIKFIPEITIGGNFVANQPVEVSASTQTIGEYIKQIYKYLIGTVGIVAVVVMMYGGVVWMMSLGNSSRVTEARAWIGASLIGLLLVFFSYAILRTINPDLVNFKAKEINPIKLPTKIDTSGCCWPKDGGASLCRNTANESECTSYGESGDFTFSEGLICGETKCIKPCEGTSGGEKCNFLNLGILEKGYCDGGKCISESIKGKMGEWCGIAGNLGICDQTCGPASPFHILEGKSCEGASIYCCKH